MEIPGFVDLQVNGFRGVNFSSPELTEEDFIQTCIELMGRGTAAFLPTVITSPLEVYRRNLPLMAEIMDRPELKDRMSGFHIEGPFISPEPGARGVHDPDLILKPDISLFEELQELACGKIKLLTIAAEVNGAVELAGHAVKHGVTVSLGHHLASEEDLQRLITAGASTLTHLGNGVPRMVDRHRNPLWAGLAEDALTAMIIPDGHHLPASLMKTIIRVKGMSNVIAVSDVSPVAGLPPGRYTCMGGEVVLEESGLLHDSVKGYLAGSSATMLDCMNVLASLKLLKY
ncbi:unnamed protein product, partial [marine sediment metagenome]